MTTFRAAIAPAAVIYTVGATAQIEFPVTFPFDEPSDLQAFVNGVAVGFSVTGPISDGFYLSGTLTLFSAVTNAQVSIVRSIELAQGLLLPVSGRINVAAINEEFSRLWLAMQDLERRTEGAVRVPDWNATVRALPPVADRAGRLVSFDTAGDVVVTPGIPGPQGPQGLQGLQGIAGERGARGLTGLKGDPGNFLGISLIGSGTSLASRPASASEGQAWGLIGADTMRIYVWTSGAWFDAGPITSPTAFPVANTIYVQEFGNNANAGTSWGTAVRSIERALELATLRGEPTLIEWGAETPILTQGHLDMPDNCVIRAAHRTVFVRPAATFETRNVFRMGSGCFIEGVMIEGFRVDSLSDPTSGFAFSFRPGAVITRVPYAHKCAVRSIPTWGLVPPPLNRAAGNPEVPVGGGVALADGGVCSPYSIFPNIMTWGATPVIPNGIGYCARRGGLINAVNAISMWAHVHFMALSGGQVLLSGCATQFGDWSMRASGSRNIVVPAAVAGTPTLQTAAAATVSAARTTIIDATWTALVSGGYTTGWTATDEAFTRSDTGLLVDCLAWMLKAADEAPIQNFIRGLFDWNGVSVIDAPKAAAFTFAFNDIATRVNALGIAAGAQTMVTAAIAAINATLAAPVTRKEPSRVTAIGHQWTAAMAGVALTKIPPAVSLGPIEDSIQELTDGVVTASGQDDEGNALFVGGLRIDGSGSGELGGQPFENAVRRLAQRAAITRSF
jgi:hypothetical protein